ncbi:MAG TPA: hypothetical protein PLH57_06305, partial [Oligoflexia bacterium]|nr:hypothetical protein [Oligoflexia bacterium]
MSEWFSTKVLSIGDAFSSAGVSPQKIWLVEGLPGEYQSKYAVSDETAASNPKILNAVSTGAGVGLGTGVALGAGVAVGAGVALGAGVAV